MSSQQLTVNSLLGMQTSYCSLLVAHCSLPPVLRFQHDLCAVVYFVAEHLVALIHL